MAIRFSCQCGKPLHAREEFAGRKMRCPACGIVLSIPDSGSKPGLSPTGEAPPNRPTVPVPRPDVDAPRQPPATRPIMFVEEETLTARANVKRESAPEDEMLDQPPVQRRSALPTQRANVWVDDSLTQQVTSWPASDQQRVGAIVEDERRRQPGRWLAAALLVLLIAAVTAGLIFRADLSKAMAANAHDMKQRASLQHLGTAWASYRGLELVPKDAPYVLTVRIAESWTRLGEPGSRTKLQTELKRCAHSLRHNFGLKPGQIERLTLFTTPSHSDNPGDAKQSLALVQTTKAYSDATFLKRWTKQVKPNAVFSPIYSLSANSSLGVAFLNDRLFLVGPLADVDRFVAQGPAKPTGAEAQRVKLMERHAALVHLNLTPASRKQVGKVMPKEMKSILALMNAEKLQATVDFGVPMVSQAVLTFAAVDKADGAANSFVNAKTALTAAAKDPKASSVTLLSARLLKDVQHQTRQLKSTQDQDTLGTLELTATLDPDSVALLLLAVEQLQRPPAPPGGMGGMAPGRPGGMPPGGPGKGGGPGPGGGQPQPKA